MSDCTNCRADSSLPPGSRATRAMRAAASSRAVELTWGSTNNPRAHDRTSDQSWYSLRCIWSPSAAMYGAPGSTWNWGIDVRLNTVSRIPEEIFDCTDMLGDPTRYSILRAAGASNLY